MAFSKREKISVVALVCLVVAVLTIAAVNNIFAEQQRERTEREETSLRKQAKTGEFLRLDSNEDLSDTLSDGNPYAAGLTWDGVMELKVNNAVLVSGLEGVERELGSLPWWAKNITDGADYLIVRYTVKNVDAKPIFENRDGIPLFMVDVNASPGSLICFDGTYNGEQALEQEAFFYELPEGEQRDYTAIYKLSKGEDVSNLHLRIGAQSVDKYTIALDARDLRE